MLWSMWLRLEHGVARNLRRRQHVDIFDLQPSQMERSSLILQAAWTVLPEESMQNLPMIARVEVAAGLTGSLREAVAAADTSEKIVEPLRNRLIKQLSGRADLMGAVSLADRIHLGRLVRGDVPAIVAVGCLQWYASYRSEADPNARAIASLSQLHDTWLRNSQLRPRLDQAIRFQATSVVGENPENLLDAVI